MTAFVALCLLSRFAYSLNDIFTGRLARTYGGMEVAAWRGVTLGVTMAPLLLWVPVSAWSRLGDNWLEYAVMIALTALSNLLQLQAARHLPFGLRAAFMISAIALGSATLGWIVLDERMTAAEISLGALLIASTVAAAPGRHADHEIAPDVPRGALYAGGAALLMAVVALLLKRLVVVCDPLLIAWAWEFGAGVVLVGPLLWSYRAVLAPGVLPRIWKIGLAASPTAVGSGASVTALEMGALGVWAAVAGTQVLFTALLGALWHREAVGPWRWVCFAVATAAVSALTVIGF